MLGRAVAAADSEQEADDMARAKRGGRGTGNWTLYITYDERKRKKAAASGTFWTTRGSEDRGSGIGASKVCLPIRVAVGNLGLPGARATGKGVWRAVLGGLVARSSQRQPPPATATRRHAQRTAAVVRPAYRSRAGVLRRVL